MSAMTQERREQRPVPAKRPVSGIAIDPERLTWWRESRGWSRQDLSDAITALNLADDDGSPLTVTRDAIAKNELGERKPKGRTVRAYCAALSTDGHPCTPRDLLPDVDNPLPPHEGSLARRSRLDYNRDLRAFAGEHGIRYKNPVSGRVYYSRPLQAAYELLILGAESTVIDVAIAEAAAAHPAEEDEGEAAVISGLTEDDGIGQLDLTARTRNTLIRGALADGGHASIATIGELTARTAGQLQAIRNLGPAALAEIREQLAATGFALAGEAVPGPAGGCGDGGCEPGSPELLAS